MTDSEHVRANIQPPGAAYDANWYVSRPIEEDRALSFLKNRMPVLLYGWRKQGRTWLAEHIKTQWISRAPEGTSRIAFNVDMRHLEDNAFDSYNNLARALALQLVDEAVEHELDPSGALQLQFEKHQNNTIGTVSHWLRKFFKLLLKHTAPQQVLVILHHADLARAGLNAQHYRDFEGVLRAMADKASANRPTWSRLRLMLCVSTDPAAMTTDAARQSPFSNLSLPIYVDDLNDSQTQQLAELYQLAETPLEPIRALVSGHVYLLRLIFNDLAHGLYPNSAFDADDSPLHLPPQSLLIHHIRRYRNRFEAQPTLREALEAIAERDAPGPITSPEHVSLRRLGLLTLDGRIRFGLYRRFLLHAEAAPSIPNTDPTRRIYLCHNPRDEELLRRLQTHLKPLERHGLIQMWTNSNLSAGEDWLEGLKSRLVSTDLCIFIVSAHLLADDQLYTITSELQDKDIMAVLARPVDEALLGPLSTARLFPEEEPDGRRTPVVRWPDPDDAWAEIVTALRMQIKNWNQTAP